MSIRGVDLQYRVAGALGVVIVMNCGACTPNPNVATSVDQVAAAAHASPEFTGVDAHLDIKQLSTINSANPFGTVIHDELIRAQGKPRECTEVLTEAQWRQDIVLSLYAPAHFDNCRFDDSFDLLFDYLEEADKAAEAGNTSGALAPLGRGLHAIQDFYSHTNYVELMIGRYGKPAEVPELVLWDSEGRKQVNSLKAQGLVSGRVWWEAGDVCAYGTPSHGDMAKDSGTTKRGAVWIDAWQMSHYQAAVMLAERATRAYLRARMLSPQWSKVWKDCGNVIGYLRGRDGRRE